MPIPDGLDFEQAPFWPLTTSAVMWIENDNIQADDTVVIVGQGLVGSLLLQVARANGQGPAGGGGRACPTAARWRPKWKPTR